MNKCLTYLITFLSLIAANASAEAVNVKEYVYNASNDLKVTVSISDLGEVSCFIKNSSGSMKDVTFPISVLFAKIPLAGSSYPGACAIQIKDQVGRIVTENSANHEGWFSPLYDSSRMLSKGEYDFRIDSMASKEAKFQVSDFAREFKKEIDASAGGYEYRMLFIFGKVSSGSAVGPTSIVTEWMPWPSEKNSK